MIEDELEERALDVQEDDAEEGDDLDVDEGDDLDLVDGVAIGADAAGRGRRRENVKSIFDETQALLNELQAIDDHEDRMRVGLSQRLRSRLTRATKLIKSSAGGLLEVTETRYKLYLKYRHAGRGNQGRAPMQLTDRGPQDRGDKLRLLEA